MRNVIAATDFSPASKRAIEVAADVASRYDARLLLIHCVDVTAMVLAADPLMGAHGMLGDLNSGSIHRDAQKRLDEIAAELPGNTDTAVIDGRPATAIVDIAKQEKADLLVLGTEGRGAVGRMMVGSVADRVVRTATVPVLTVCREAAKQEMEAVQ